MSLTFILNDFASTATPDVSANFPAPVTDTFGAFDAIADCNMKVSVAQNLFQFWTDSYDMCNNTLSDILYKLNYDTSSGYNAVATSAVPLTSDFIKGSYVQVGSTTMNPDGNPYITVPDDYLRYIAKCLFNTTRGVDLFNNEEQVLNSVDHKSQEALHTVLATMLQSANTPFIYDHDNYQYTGIDLSGNPSGRGAQFNSRNPSKKLLTQIMAGAPSRFTNLETTYGIAGTKWVKMPLLAGDKIVFPLTIASPVGQNSLTGSTAIANRTYKIIVTIVSDATALNAGLDYPARP